MILQTLVFSLVINQTVISEHRLQPGEPAPAGSHIEMRPKTWLWVTGLSLFVASYVAVGAVTTALCADSDPTPCARSTVALSWVPLVGPWIILPTARGAQLVALAVGGTVQAAGLAMLILGLVLKDAWVVAGANVYIAPVFSPQLAGMQLQITY